jgi:flagellar hook-associated protein 1 FlgK
MNLVSAFNSARESLAFVGASSSLVSRNIAGATDSSYSRKSAVVLESAGGARLSGVTRASDASVMVNYRNVGATAARDAELSKAHNAIQLMTNGAGSVSSLSSRVGFLADALQLASTQPHDLASLNGVVGQARSVISTINTTAKGLVEMAAASDEVVRESVSIINSLLVEFGAVQERILTGAAPGADLSDLFDRRDSILSSLSFEVGIATIENRDGSMSILASGGSVLFDREPRPVFIRSRHADNGVPAGTGVFIDNVDVSVDRSAMRVTSGRLAGALAVRDVIVPQAMDDLDSIAHSLIVSFGEVPSVGGAGSFSPGLFTLASGSVNPQTVAPGSALGLAVHPHVDPDKGGDSRLLRDGGISFPGDPTYVRNPSRAPGYSARLIEMLSKMSQPSEFVSSSNVGDGTSLFDRISLVVGDLSRRAQDASSVSEQSRILGERLSAALSRATGVDIDQEMTRLLQIENSYKATSKMIATIDNLYSSLFAAIR